MLDTVKQFGLSGSDKLNKSLERTLGISDFSNFITILFNAIIVFLGAICGAITKERDPEFIKKEAEELAAIRVAKAYQRGIRTQVIRADDRQVKKKIEEISKKTEIPIATKIPQILTPESKKQREEVKKKSSDQIIQ